MTTDPRPARVRRAQRARPRRRRPPRDRAAHGARCDGDALDAPTRRCASAARASRSRGRPATCATAASRIELTVRGAEPIRRRCARRFEALHEERYGYRDPDGEVELVTVRVTAREPGAAGRLRRARPSRARSSGPTVVAPARGDARRARGLGGAHRRHRHARAGARGMSLDPIALQVVDRRAARRVRGDGRRARALGALGQHQGAPRLLDRAVRRRRRDGHAGRAHPGAPRRDARRRRRRARATTTRRACSWVLNDPYRRRHPPARHHRRHAGLRTAASCSASPPAAPTTPTSAGACPARCPPTRRRSTRRASSSRRACSTTAAIDELAGADAPARRSAAPTCARSSPPTASARARLARAGRPRRRSTRCARRPRRCSTTPSGARARAWPALDDGTRTAVDVLEARRGRPRAARWRRPSTATS